MSCTKLTDYSPYYVRPGVDQVGGVVLRSPLIAIAAYEQEQGIPNNYINCSMFVCIRYLYVFGPNVDRVVLEQNSKRPWRFLAKI